MMEKSMMTPATAVPMSTGLAVAFERVAGSVVLLEVVFGNVEVGIEAEVAL